MTTGMLPSGTMAARSVISKPRIERGADVTVCVEELAGMVWAVRVGFCDRAHTDGVSGAAAVFHDDGLREPRRHLIHDEARHDIGGAAGGPKGKHPGGVCWPNLRPG